jgi:hypothetical protein
MATTIINLKVKTVEEKAVTPQNNQLGNMIASSDDITVINGDPSLRGQHSSFFVRVRRPDFGCVKLDTSCRESQAHLSRMAVNSRPEGSSSFPVW